MRILYLDIDSLRPDHLGCYGYHRQTSPSIDRIAAQGVRFSNVYASDTPCLPSRSALFSGRFGIHTGVIGHGGSAADPFVEGPERGFGSLLSRTSWMRCVRNAGLHTVAISPFAERHAAWHFYANFNEVHNTGRRGLEAADEIGPVAVDWIRAHGQRDSW
ncbi:MAG: sulfatase-like hydrolase/transferase, partial [Myxococcota bacterium]